jgi:hypothetical protein
MICPDCEVSKQTWEFGYNDRTKAPFPNCHGCRAARRAVKRGTKWKPRPTRPTPRSNSVAALHELAFENRRKRDESIKRLTKKFALTPEQVEVIRTAKMAGCCICGGTEGKLKLNYNCETNKIRGWLCRYCNIMLGMAADRQDILHKGADFLDNPPLTSEIHGV